MKGLVIFFTFLLLGYSFAANFCSEVPAGEEHSFSYPGDCTRFIRCSSNEASFETCAGGEYFNEELQACEDPSISGCVPMSCPPGVVEYYSYPGDCTRYIECYQGTGEVHSCPDGTYFRSDQKRCVSQQDSDCAS